MVAAAHEKKAPLVSEAGAFQRRKWRPPSGRYIDRSGQKRWLVDGAKLLDPKTLEVVGHLTDAGKINTPQDKSPAGNDDPSRPPIPLRCGRFLEENDVTCALSSFSFMFFAIMPCCLFIDEVGNDDTRSPSERYLSLTGIITKAHGHDHRITPAIEALKTKFFGHDPPRKVVVLHRREIVRREPPFDCLWDDGTNAKWEDALIGLIEYLPYIAITVMIDKLEHVEKYTVWQFNPYHYCMRALIERYVLWLGRVLINSACECTALHLIATGMRTSRKVRVVKGG